MDCARYPGPMVKQAAAVGRGVCHPSLPGPLLFGTASQLLAQYLWLWLRPL